MRVISVSTDVYAKIWSMREDKEEDENSILKRLLWLPITKSRSKVAEASVDFIDPQHRVHFAEGFEIFRNYLGTEFRAVATSG